MQPSFSSILYCGNIFLFENIFFPKKQLDLILWFGMKQVQPNKSKVYHYKPLKLTRIYLPNTARSVCDVLYTSIQR